MAHESLREFLGAAAEIDEVQLVEGADRDRDIGCLTELSNEMGGPMLLFDRIIGFPPGFRVCANPLRTPRQFALAMGFPLDAHPLDLVRLWRDKRKVLQSPIRPVVVPDGPLFATRYQGEDVDLELFPTPYWHEGDGGRYLGTADMVVLRDPDAGWVNVGTYRGMIQSRNRLSLWIVSSKHGRILLEKHWARGQAAPAAVVLGCDPLTWMTAPMSPPFGTSEYEFAGAYRGSPLQVVELPLTHLPVPATSEIVLEGEIRPFAEESAHEGPFGEWPGYYSHEGQEVVLRVQQIHHQTDPILLGSPPLRPLKYAGGLGIPTFTVQLWDHLERGGVTDVTGVWGFGNTLLMVVSLKQRYAGHAKQALLAMAGFRSGASMYRTYVVVDEDIDVTNLEEVVWAISTRADPGTSMEILHSAWTSDLDPRLSPEQRATGEMTMGRLLIDACRPFAWKERFPATNVFSRERRRETQERWASLLQQLGRRR